MWAEIALVDFEIHKHDFAGSVIDGCKEFGRVIGQIENDRRTANSRGGQEDFDVLVAIACKDADGVSMLESSTEESSRKSFASTTQVVEGKLDSLMGEDELLAIDIFVCLLVN